MRLATAARAAGEQSTCVKRAPTCRARRSSRRVRWASSGRQAAAAGSTTRAALAAADEVGVNQRIGHGMRRAVRQWADHGPVHLTRGEVKNQFLGCRRHEARGHLGQQARHAVILRHSDGLDIGRIEQGPRVGWQRVPVVRRDEHPAGNRRRRSATDSPASQSSRRGSRIEQPTKTTGYAGAD